MEVNVDVQRRSEAPDCGHAQWEQALRKAVFELPAIAFR